MKLRLKSLEKVFTWQWSVKSPNTIIPGLLRVSGLIVGKFNPSLIKAIFVLIFRLHQIRKKNGSSYLARYMKACHLILMKSYSYRKNIDIHSGIFDPRVSVNRAGLPRIIPSY